MKLEDLNVGDRVEFKEGTADYPGEKAEVVYIKPDSALLLVKMDNGGRGWLGASGHRIPTSLRGTRGLWWAYPRELSLIEHKDKTWPGYDID